MRIQKNTTSQQDLTTAEYVLFSSAHGIFTKINHILDQKAKLNEWKRVKTLIDYVLCQKWTQTRSKYQKDGRKTSKYLGMRQYISKQSIIEGSIRENKKSLDQNKTKNKHTKINVVN